MDNLLQIMKSGVFVEALLRKCGADGWMEKYEKELVALS